MKTQNILKNMVLTVIYPHENSQEKKRILSEKPFSKDNFNYDYEMMTYICPFGQPLYKKANINTKTKLKSHIGPKNAKTAQCKNTAAKHKDTE